MDNLEHWVDSINPTRINGQTDGMLRALVGTKIDLERVVSAGRAKTIADVLEIEPSMVFEVNALTGQGVQEMFNKIVQRMAAPVTSMETIDIINPRPIMGKPCPC